MCGYNPYQFDEALEHLDSCGSYWGTRPEDCCGAILVELVVVLSWDNTTYNNHDILTTELLELCEDLWNEGEVTCCE